VIVDLMNEDESEKFVQSVTEKNKTIDVAVLTVGGFAMGSIAETKMADILKQHKLNFPDNLSCCSTCICSNAKAGQWKDLSGRSKNRH
jgi:short-subunit dehydrogenase